jgi:hypothetical protein
VIDIHAYKHAYMYISDYLSIGKFEYLLWLGEGGSDVIWGLLVTL